MSNHLNSIFNQMRENNVNAPIDFEPNGTIHRFQGKSTKSKNSAWAIGYKTTSAKNFEEIIIVVYGDFAMPNCEKLVAVSSKSGTKFSKEDKKLIDSKIEQAKQKIQREREVLANKAAEEAVKIFNSLDDEMKPNDYLLKKGINNLYGARIFGKKIAIPMVNSDGEIRNLELISDGGAVKKGLYGGARIGLFHVIGEDSDVIYIGEGFATCVAIHKVMGSRVIVCFNASNIPAVAKIISEKYKDKKIIICGDNDQYPNKDGETHNIGLEKAKHAASIIGAKYVVPRFKNLDDCPTDFDDLYRTEGHEEVFKQIDALNPKEICLSFDSNYVINFPYPDEISSNGKSIRQGTMDNLEELLSRLKIICRYNVITKEEEILIPGSGFTTDNREVATLAYVIDWCERVSIPTANIASYITAICERNQYNPVLTWIESKPWDGVSRLDDLFKTIVAVNEKEDPMVLIMKETLMKKWLISAVAAASEPFGVSAHGVLVFQGRQYLGKTQWLKSLVPSEMGIVADGVLLYPDNKDSVLNAIKNWIVELGELDGTISKSEAAQLKAFLTKSYDEIRRPFAKKQSKYARRTVFFGSVNENTFLKDPTGSRRFWIIECESIIYDHKIDMQQLWAEVRDLYLNGHTWLLSNEEVVRLNKDNESYSVVDPINELIMTNFRWDDAAEFEWLNATQVCQALGIEIPKQNETRSAANSLKKLTKSRKKDGYMVYKIPRKHTASSFKYNI